MSRRLTSVENDDRDMWYIVTNVPRVDKFVAIFVLIVNLFLPGLGTAIAACASKS